MTPNEPDPDARAWSSEHGPSPVPSEPAPAPPAGGDPAEPASSRVREPEVLLPREPEPTPRRFVIRGPERPLVGPILIALNVLWFLWMVVQGVSAIDPGAEDGLRFGANHGPAIAAGEWWRLLSAGFVHYGLLHLGMNMWAVWVLAPLAERLYGRGAFLVLYLLGAIGCSCASMLMKPETFSAGASGAVFATMGGIFVFFLLHRREMPPGMFAATMKWIGWLLGINLVLGLTNPNIDNAGHFGGLVAGIAAGWCLDRDPSTEPRLDAKRIGATVFFALMLGGLCALIPSRVAKSPRAGVMIELSRAQDAWERSDWAGVDEHASAALHVSPDDVDALELRALARAAMNRADAALADCDHALRADPTTPEARRLRALLRAHRGEFEPARKDLERLVELLPSNARARLLLGEAQLALGDARKAAVTLEAAVKLDERESSDAQVWLWMARAELGLRAEADAGLAEFEGGAFGQELQPIDARAIEVALRGTTKSTESAEAELHGLLRALRALHPVSGSPDVATARAELAASVPSGGEPWLAAYEQRLMRSIAR